jgi:hypothetical protein
VPSLADRAECGSQYPPLPPDSPLGCCQRPLHCIKGGGRRGKRKSGSRRGSRLERGYNFTYGRHYTWTTLHKHTHKHIHEHIHKHRAQGRVHRTHGTEGTGRASERKAPSLGVAQDPKPRHVRGSMCAVLMHQPRTRLVQPGRVGVGVGAWHQLWVWAHSIRQHRTGTACKATQGGQNRQGMYGNKGRTEQAWHVWGARYLAIDNVAASNTAGTCWRGKLSPTRAQASSSRVHSCKLTATCARTQDESESVCGRTKHKHTNVKHLASVSRHGQPICKPECPVAL